MYMCLLAPKAAERKKDPGGPPRCISNRMATRYNFPDFSRFHISPDFVILYHLLYPYFSRFHLLYSYICSSLYCINFPDFSRFPNPFCKKLSVAEVQWKISKISDRDLHMSQWPTLALALLRLLKELLLVLVM